MGHIMYALTMKHSYSHDPCKSTVRRRKALLLLVLSLLIIRTSKAKAAQRLAFAAPLSQTRVAENVQPPSEKPALIRHRGRVAYDGTGFAGFQIQPNGKRTVQGQLEQVLSRRFNRTVRVVGAGRTDAGVHANGQAFHFDLFQEEIEKQQDDVLPRLQHSMNRMLTQDVRVWNVTQAPLPVLIPLRNGTSGLINFQWHSIYNSTQKLYSYRFSTGCVMNPLLRMNRWHVDYKVDTERLARVVKHFEGTHDFRAFAGAIEQNEKKNGRPIPTIRTIDRAELINEGNGNYRIDFLLRGALYKMVRNMVSSAIDVCREGGRINEEKLLALLHQEQDEPNRVFTRYDNRCKPAPPNGLTLEKVFYDDGTTF